MLKHLGGVPKQSPSSGKGGSVLILSFRENALKLNVSRRSESRGSKKKNFPDPSRSSAKRMRIRASRENVTPPHAFSLRALTPLASCEASVPEKILKSENHIAPPLLASVPTATQQHAPACLAATRRARDRRICSACGVRHQAPSAHHVAALPKYVPRAGDDRPCRHPDGRPGWVLRVVQVSAWDSSRIVTIFRLR